MHPCVFNIEKPLIYNWTGKFIAPGSEWQHLKRILYDYELMVVTYGTLYLAGDGQEFCVKRGEFLLLPPLTEQFGTKSSQCEFYWLHFAQNEGNIHFLSAEEIKDESYTCANGQTRYRILRLPHYGTLSSLERMVILLKQLQDTEQRYHNPSYNDICVTNILWELACQQNSAFTSIPKRSHEQLYTDICNYISLHIAEPIQVDEIAVYYGYNPRYLTALFKEISGTTLKTYILSQKMELAKALLSDESTPILQIAHSLGFQDNHNFSSCFKKITGMSPTQYRKSFSQNIIFWE